jgi:hypothetical protein
MRRPVVPKGLLRRGLLGPLLAVVLATMPALLAGQTAAPVARSDADVARVLAAPTDLEILNMPLAEFVKTVSQRYGLTIRLDAGGLRRAGVSPSIKLTASFHQLPLGLALKQVLRPLKLQHHVADGAIVVDDVGLPLDDAHPPGGGPVGRQVDEVQERPAAPVRRAPAVRVARAQRFANAEEASLQQLRLILQVELNFVKSTCAPTPEQIRELKQEALKQLAEIAKAQGPDNVRRVFVQNGGQVMVAEGGPAQKDSRGAVQEKLGNLVRARLSPAQASRYESELKKRKENLRRTCARNLVVSLDEELCLTESQRQKLFTELADNWNDSWTTTLVMRVSNPAWLPDVPDELVVPHLDAAQRSRWHSMPKRGNIVWGAGAAPFLGMGPPALENQD